MRVPGAPLPVLPHEDDGRADADRRRGPAGLVGVGAFTDRHHDGDVGAQQPYTLLDDGLLLALNAPVGLPKPRTDRLEAAEEDVPGNERELALSFRHREHLVCVRGGCAVHRSLNHGIDRGDGRGVVRVERLGRGFAARQPQQAHGRDGRRVNPQH